MDFHPRAGFAPLRRYLPDRSPVFADLSDNRNHWGAHPAALEAVAGARPSLLSEYPSSYGDELAEAVAAKWGVAREAVVTGVGGTGVLDMAVRAVAPSQLRYLAPGWPAAAMLALMNGHEPVAVDWDEGMADPERFAGRKRCIVYVVNPANPTGERLPDEWVAAVHRAAERAGSVTIVDEAYAEYGDDGGGRHGLDLALAAERTLWVRTMSKAYGLAGLRSGYGVGSPSLALEADKARGPFALSGLASVAGAAALSSDSAWLSETLASARHCREGLRERLGRRGFDVPPSQANFVFVPWPESRLEAVVRGLEAGGARVRPFGSAGREAGLRVTVAPWEAMLRFLEALDGVTRTEAPPPAETGAE